MDNALSSLTPRCPNLRVSAMPDRVEVRIDGTVVARAVRYPIADDGQEYWRPVYRGRGGMLCASRMAALHWLYRQMGVQS